MILSRYRSMFGVVIATASIACAAFAAVAHRVQDTVREVTAFLVDLAFSLFAPRDLPLYAFAVATAPRVSGLHQTRSFVRRMLQRGDGGTVCRSRAPLSTALVAT